MTFLYNSYFLSLYNQKNCDDIRNYFFVENWRKIDNVCNWIPEVYVSILHTYIIRTHKSTYVSMYVGHILLWHVIYDCIYVHTFYTYVKCIHNIQKSARLNSFFMLDVCRIEVYSIRNMLRCKGLFSHLLTSLHKICFAMKCNNGE